MLLHVSLPSKIPFGSARACLPWVPPLRSSEHKGAEPVPCTLLLMPPNAGEGRCWLGSYFEALMWDIALPLVSAGCGALGADLEEGH